MKPEELKLPDARAVEMQAVTFDQAYVTDNPEIMSFLPKEMWAVFVRKTYDFQAKKSAMLSQIYSAQAEMLEAKSELIGKHIR